MRFGTLMRAVVLIGVCAAKPAAAAMNIDCISSGYSAEQQATITAQVSVFTMADMGDHMFSALLPMIHDRAEACAQQYGWSPDAMEQAIRYLLATFMQGGLEHSQVMSEDEVRNFKAVIVWADQERLLSTMAPILNGSSGSDDDEAYLQSLVTAAGLPLEGTLLEFAGALLASMVVQKIAVDNFAQF
ncbi:MAG: hypothetical protein LBF16_05790 [Pseudomonadales bacterium]|jgi:hypothetical protein|nr:hypothetical protein [Pseudomonadales bacterium]